MEKAPPKSLKITHGLESHCKQMNSTKNYGGLAKSTMDLASDQMSFQTSCRPPNPRGEIFRPAELKD